MDTTERMMIMGMCLQGLLANTAWSKTKVADTRMVRNTMARTALEIGAPTEIEETFYRPLTDAEADAQRRAVVKEAHLIADALDPPPEKTDAEAIARLTGIAYEALRSQKMLVRPDIPWSEAKGTEEGDPVFDAVQLYYHSPTALTVTAEDRLVQAIVRAAK